MQLVKTESYIRDMDGEGFTSDVGIELLKAVTEQGMPFRFMAPGFSMHPFIRNQDIITIAPLSADRPLLGDVVAFIRPDTGKLTVHRVVKTGDNVFLIKGDNTEETDGMVSRMNIFGTVTRVERNGRNVTAGLGCEKRFIAFLSRYHILRRISWLISLPKIIGAAGLQKAQKSVVYRRIVRRLRPRITIHQADEREMDKISTRWRFERPHNMYHPDLLITNFVAKTGIKIIGCIRLVRRPSVHFHPCYWLFDLMVKIPYRGMGIGEELALHVIHRAQEEGAKELILLINENNQPAVTLFRKLQFEPVLLTDIEEHLGPEFETPGKRRVAMHRLI